MLTKEYIANCGVRDFDAMVSEVFDCREGVVIDSFIGIDNDGEMFVAIDTYETCWTSGYTVYRGNENDLWNVWDEFTAEYDEGYGEAV